MIACIICTRTFTPKDTGIKLDKQDMYTGAEYVCSVECKKLHEEKESLWERIEERKMRMKFSELHKKLNTILDLFPLSMMEEPYVPNDNKEMYTLYENLRYEMRSIEGFVRNEAIYVQD